MERNFGSLDGGVESSPTPMPMSHSGYLKLYQLRRPRLDVDYDVIMLDEAQDTNPAIRDIVMRSNAPRLLEVTGTKPYPHLLVRKMLLSQCVQPELLPSHARFALGFALLLLPMHSSSFHNRAAHTDRAWQGLRRDSRFV